MKKRIHHFSKNERLILKVIHDERSPLSIREISKKTSLSWITTRKYLKILKEKGWVRQDMKI